MFTLHFFLQGFREGTFQVLVATDVAARGLDIPEVDLVIQTEPPKARRDGTVYFTLDGTAGRMLCVGGVRFIHKIMHTAARSEVAPTTRSILSETNCTGICRIFGSRAHSVIKPLDTPNKERFIALLDFAKLAVFYKASSPKGKLCSSAKFSENLVGARFSIERVAR